MGVSTDAKLFYGILIEEGSDAHDRIVEEVDDDMDDVELLAKNILGYMQYHGRAIDGVELVYHGSDACTMYALAAADSEILAWRGDPKNLGVNDRGNPDVGTVFGWDAALKAFCKKHKVPYKKPTWYLCSYWG
jgi:hypothetical protein